MSAAYLLFGLFILFAYTAEAMTGFGSIVIALSLGALLFPIEFLQTVLVPLNICMTGYLSWKHRAAIDWPLLLRLILPFMLLGTVLGVVLQPHLGGKALKFLFALLILWFAARELWRAGRGLPSPIRSPLWSRVVVSIAGLTHGLFASGGPLLVYGLAGMSMDKARFRATLILVWFSLNSMLTAVFLWQGRIQPHAGVILAYVALIPVGVVLGEYLHHRVDEDRFKLWIYRLLIVAALGLMSSSFI
ncbi:MAG: sulfite exporter TauE/SafE family protein [Oceanococcus sp.]